MDEIALNIFAPEWDVDTTHGHRYSLATLFSYPAKRCPSSPALSDGVRTFSFGELDKRAASVAAILWQRGLQKTSIVVLADKNILIPVIAVAIWSVGGVYVPIDPSYPALRIQQVLSEVGAAAIIGASHILDELPDFGIETLRLDSLDVEQQAQIVPKFENQESDPAYIIFTSGSTGLPKGVVISHQNAIDYFKNHNSVLRFTMGSRVLSLAPFYFDVSIEDTFLPLSVGAFVFQFRGLFLPTFLHRALVSERITHLIAVSSLLTLLTRGIKEVSEREFPHIQMVMTGAEVCDPKIINLWVRGLPNARVINAYGPTEATIVCCTYHIKNVDSDYDISYPIGSPLSRVSAMLIDENGREISIPGEKGELLIGGSQIMIGYLNNHDETSDRILVKDGIRYFKTRDLCCLDQRGNFVFLGRLDSQVKLSGKRVELDEIRFRALQAEGVTQATVKLVTRNGREILALLAVFSREGNPRDLHDQLVNSLSQNLPAYMIPQIIAISGSAYLRGNGKEDANAMAQALEKCAELGTGAFFAASEKVQHI